MAREMQGERESSPGTCFSLLVIDEGGLKRGRWEDDIWEGLRYCYSTVYILLSYLTLPHCTNNSAYWRVTVLYRQRKDGTGERGALCPALQRWCRLYRLQSTLPYLTSQ